MARVSVKPPQSTEPIEDHADTDDDDDIIDAYDDITHGGVQPERGPLQNYMVHHALCLTFPYVCTFSIIFGLTELK